MLTNSTHNQNQAWPSRLGVELNQAEAQIQAHEDQCQMMVAATDDLTGAVESQLADLLGRLQHAPSDLRGPAWEALEKLAAEGPRSGTARVFRQVMDIRSRSLAARREACEAMQAAVRSRDEVLHQLQDHIGACAKLLTEHEARRRAPTKPIRIQHAPPPVHRGERREERRDEHREERRASPRVPVQAVVTMSSDDNFYTGFSTDLSDSGVFVATINLEEIGTEIELAIKLPDGTTIQSRGEVRWVREWNDNTPTLHPGMGIRFIDLSAAQRAHVRDFLACRDALFFDA